MPGSGPCHVTGKTLFLLVFAVETLKLESSSKQKACSFNKGCANFGN